MLIFVARIVEREAVSGPSPLKLRLALQARNGHGVTVVLDFQDRLVAPEEIELRAVFRGEFEVEFGAAGAERTCSESVHID